MKKLVIAIGILGTMSASSLFATTTYAFLNSRAAGQNSDVWGGNPEDISPYGGSVGSSITGGAGNSAVKLFCDDFADGVAYNSGWQVNVTTVNAADLTNTRYGAANLNPSYPSGTTLYEEIAWLFTQTVQVTQTVANQNAIGEAVWTMTGSGTPTASALSLQWISLAQSDYNHTVAGYATPDYTRWLILTDPAAKANTGGTGKQEMLAYYTAGGLPQVTASSPTPEPGTCVLGGLGFLAAGYFGRRRKGSGR